MSLEFPLLDDIVKIIYPPEDLSRVNALITKYELQALLNNTLSRFRSSVSQLDKSYNQTQASLSALATSFLTTINIKLQLVKDELEKRELQNLVSDIATQMVNSIIEKYKGEAVALLRMIDESLIHTCEINGYNVHELRQIFPVHRFALIAEAAHNTPRIKKVAKDIYYTWNSRPENLRDLAQTLKDKEVIKQIKSFENLFRPPVQNFAVLFNSEQRDMLIVLFQELYNRKLIRVKGNRGYFVPLQLYGVDFEKRVLITEAPRAISYAINKNQLKRKRLLEQVSKWLSGFEPKS